MSLLYQIYTVFAVFFGLVIGSFWNVAIARWPQDRSVVKPRSACPSCGTPIAWFDNIPILSWVLLRGECRECGWSIPALYPLIELLGGLLGLLLYWRFIPNPSALQLPNILATIVYGYFVTALIVSTYVDIRHRIIPDEVSIYAVPVGIAGCALLEWVGYTGPFQIGWRGAVLGAACGGGTFAGLAAAAYFLTGREALGLGDVKMLAMIGAFLGPHPALFLILFGASVSSSVIGLGATAILRRRVFLPFGPALAAWSLVYLFYADQLLLIANPAARWTWWI